MTGIVPVIKIAGFYLVFWAGLLLLAQGAVYVLSFGRHEDNAVYRFIRFLTSPVTRVVRVLTPAKVADRHVPIVAFFLLFWVWVFVFDGIRIESRPPGSS